VLEYGKQFLNEYKDNRKFLLLEFMDNHEGTGELINYLDSNVANFLEEGHKSGVMNNTAVVVMSDHGLHMHGVYRILDFEIVKLEISLPMLFIKLPTKKINNSTYLSNLDNN
jgi:membrane-anchored protein YejM (alkaline phosphatase superfamily)